MVYFSLFIWNMFSLFIWKLMYNIFSYMFYLVFPWKLNPLKKQWTMSLQTSVIRFSWRSFKNNMYTLPLRWYSRRSESNSANRNDVPDFDRLNTWRCDPHNTLYRVILSLRACIDGMQCICKYGVTLRRIAKLKK